jgi:hypothetical protein
MEKPGREHKKISWSWGYISEVAKLKQPADLFPIQVHAVCKPQLI